ncbi:hypothetical protein [Pseudaminobacter sp. NGMCC 1.201702]
MRQDLAYLTKQAAELRQLKQAARASGNEYDSASRPWNGGNMSVMQFGS